MAHSPTFYASPHGSDQWSGRFPEPTPDGCDGPFQTLPAALQAIRAWRKAHGDGRQSGQETTIVGVPVKTRSVQPSSHPVVLQLRSGTYTLEAPITLGPLDSHLTIEAYPGEQPVIEGAIEIRGWREEVRDGKRIWITQLPEVPREGRFFRELYVNGCRRYRARLPKFNPDTEEGRKRVFTIGEIRRRGGNLPPLHAGDSWFQPKTGDVQDWPSLYDAEAVILHFWNDERLPHLRFNPKTGWLRSSHQTIFALTETFDEKLARYYIDNLFEALSEPGEWYLNRETGELFYLPLPDEELGKTVIKAPRLWRFLEVKGEDYGEFKDGGEPQQALPVSHIRLAGLIFQFADWIQPTGQSLPFDPPPTYRDVPLSCGPQGCREVPGALAFRLARHCVIEDCEIREVGCTAIEVGFGCRDIEIRRCHLHHLGTGGISIDGAEEDGAEHHKTGQITVSDCEIHTLGRIRHAGVAIFIGNASENQIVHNHIYDLFYVAVHVGWSWGYKETVTKNNWIAWNHIHHVGQGLLSDLAAVYTLGVQPGTCVVGNIVHDIRLFDYGGWGLYMDEGSSHILVEKNLIYNIQGPGIHLHFGRHNWVRNNLLAATGDAMVSNSRAEDRHVGLYLRSNIFIGRKAGFPLYQSGYAGTIREGYFESDLNLLCFPEDRPGGIQERPEAGGALTFEEWQKRGQDLHSVIAPWKGGDYTRDGFRLVSDEILKQIGFQSVDWSQAGPRRREG